MGMVWLALLTACTPPPQAPLVLGLAPWIGYDPFILAREERLLDEQRVKVVELSTNAEAVRHFRNGLLDLAAMTLDQALQLAGQGIDLRVIAVLDESQGADVVVAAPRLGGLAGLRGQTIAAEPSTVSALMLRAVLEQAGLKPSDVLVMPLEASQHLAVLQAGRAAAAVSYEPLASQLLAAGYVRLFDSRQMPGEIIDVLAVRSEVLRDRPQDVDEVLYAWTQGLQRLQTDPGAAAELLAPSLQMTSGDYLSRLQELRLMTPADSLAYMAGVQAPIRKRGQRVAETLVDLGQLTQLPDWGALVDIGPAGRTVQPRERP
jgi:NitT/TauT family transport system substrate-binding protein